MERAGFYRVDGALGERIGARTLPTGDARYKLDRIYMSEKLEEEGPPGPACFGPRIMKEPPPPVSQFQLGRSTRPYNGSTKPQDWLADYVSAVYIAGGNRRWAVRYLPYVGRASPDLAE